MARPAVGVEPPRFDRAFLIDLYRRYREDLASLKRFEGHGASFGGAYHKEERRILYMMVRAFAPELIVEFSPKRGLTTAHMALALEHNGRGRILSFELSYRHLRRAWANLRAQGLSHRVEFVFGDVRQELPRTLARLAPPVEDGLEFVFIDSDHGADFARWYLAAVLPFVRRGGVVHIHDIQSDPLAPRAALPLPPNGEELEVRRFLAAHRDRYEWLSIGDCVHDPAYLAAARAFGGGDVSLDPGEGLLQPGRVQVQWNPSLWLIKRAAREAAALVDVPFARRPESPIRRLGRAVRRRWLATRRRWPA